MTEWDKRPPIDSVSELRAASRMYKNQTFADAADELERLRAMADRFRDVAQDEYAGFLADYAIARQQR
jgi:hypothetical protein